jgi:hypothetical protein
VPNLSFIANVKIASLGPVFCSLLSAWPTGSAGEEQPQNFSVMCCGVQVSIPRALTCSLRLLSQDLTALCREEAQVSSPAPLCLDSCPYTGWLSHTGRGHSHFSTLCPGCQAQKRKV